MKSYAVMMLAASLLLASCSSQLATPAVTSTGRLQTSTSPDTAVQGSLAFAFIQMISPAGGWGIGAKGGLWSTSDGGKHWRGISPDAVKNQPGLVTYRLNERAGWVYDGAKQVVYRTTDGGANWELGEAVKPSVVNDSGMALHFVDERHGWLELMSGGHAQTAELFRSDDGGLHWTSVSKTDGKGQGAIPFGADISFADPLHGWIGRPTDEGKDFPDQLWLFRTTNGGATWSPQQLPIPAQYGTVWKQTEPPRFFDAKNGILRVTYVLPDANRSYKLVLFRTTDGGNTWQPGPDLPTGGGGNLSVQFRDASHGWVWTTEKTAADQQHGKLGKLYRTDDGGRDWTEVVIAPNTPSGFIRLYDNQHGSLVVQQLSASGSADLQLLTTADGGKTWAAVKPEPAAK